MKKETRGGPRKGAGLKKGTKHKNALKKPSERHTTQKVVTYTPCEFKLVLRAMAKRAYTKHTEFSRTAALRFANEILTEY